MAIMSRITKIDGPKCPDTGIPMWEWESWCEI